MKDINILSYNVNGIRAAVKNGLLDWLQTVSVDVLCVQEIKIALEDFDPKPFEALGFECHLFPAQKKGYSGVAIFTKIKNGKIQVGMGVEKYDFEGRNIRYDLGDLTILNSYFPSGTTGDERQEVKMDYLADFFEYLQELKKTRKKLVICGDYNICHTEIDIHNPKQNKNTSGFKPEERAWMEKYFTTGMVDSFRHFNPDLKDNYTWWSYRFESRKNNKGWRIDYIATTENLKENLQEVKTYQEAIHSDHCAISLKISL